MNASEAIAMAELLTDEDYTDTNWIKIMNMVLDELTPIAKMLTTKQGISVTISGSKGEININSDPDLSKYHELVNVFYTPSGGVEVPLRKIPPGDLTSPGWFQDTAKIYLRGLSDGVATIKVDYYRRLNRIVQISDVIDLPEQYCYIVILGMCAKSQQLEEELEDKRDFAAEYMLAKQQFAYDRIWAMEPQNRRLIQQARLMVQLGAKR